MTRVPEPWWHNPFWLGGLGLALLLAGHFLLRSPPLGAGTDAPLDPVGRLAVLLGLFVVIAAGVRWFRQARLPEPPAAAPPEQLPEEGEANEPADEEE